MERGKVGNGKEGKEPEQKLSYQTLTTLHCHWWQHTGIHVNDM